ncbi:TonB-dependent receptor [uncultured Microbulbifer sp.]|uniref:TonB-dependent receptor n=1 Tax=uncultured Microbulbifer sp. TaxID=348147 RepID=UPI002638DC36|nr:TonB-dependent receptor [uncultured Microbulbifer sp.]
MSQQSHLHSGFTRTPIYMAVALASSLSFDRVSAQDDIDAGPEGLEEIVVTAQKRTENIMEVPISIGTFSDEDIDKSGVLDIRDMANYVAGVTIGEGQLTQAEITIRGITSTNISSGGDPSVATFYDGEYLPRTATTVGFSDVERVEILKGPQGTLFGRNAAAGVINILPKKPNGELEAFVSTKIGNYGLQQYEAMGNLPLTGNLFLRANVMTNDRDGYVDNLGNGDDLGIQNSTTARLSLLWQASDTTDLQLSYDYDKVDQGANPVIGVGPAAYSTDPFSGKTSHDVIDGGEKRDMYAVGVRLNHEFNNQWSLNYSATTRNIETTNVYDEDGTSDITRYLSADNFEDSESLYTELQVNFTSDDLTAVMGASYSGSKTDQIIPINLSTDALHRFVTTGMKEDPDLKDRYNAAGKDISAVDNFWNPDDWAVLSEILAGVSLPQTDQFYGLLSAAIEEPLFFGPSHAGQFITETIYNSGDFTSWGIYTDIGYSFTEKFDMFFGLRYSSDTKEFSWETPLADFYVNNPELGITDNAIFPMLPKVKAEETWSKTTGRVVANYKLTEDIITFASYSTGYKSGGFDSLNVTTALLPLDPEVVTNFELGIKGDFFDNRLRVQASAYNMSVEGAQNVVQSQPPEASVAAPRLINTDVENAGVEFTVDWIALPDLRLSLITQYMKAEQTPEQYYDALGDQVGGETTKGKSKPEDAYTFRMDYTPEIAVGSINFHLDYIYNRNDATLDLNYLDQYDAIPGYGGDRQRLHGRIDWYSDDDTYQVSLWGKNLTDEEYVSTVGGFGQTELQAPIVTIEEPRTYGVDVRYNF